ncbi:hypothetical protein SPRG_12724 [Saprolegnia parasitica CBS 223.65]|uniref:Uncharacterized protein n=1 Tax=Saprolegnia parasitica (strain CBS 223.65) TaxID=695850 RepID=A0A067BVY3_SAPPC|nr:hypothetical protein SPRG_12724 [Saprolegnia parasitica CBS 223.65]KDO22443.1 hypothetical protein SPRG_12724 [Saprolegnia parasitica CBS 223.65]|eukprot:XP_012206831.1 hypothetical protein SPRG_12724 [Saprolegnia parasitica CBS 223.65]
MAANGEQARLQASIQAKASPETRLQPAPKPASNPAPKPASNPAPKPASNPGPKPASNPAPRPVANPGPRPAPNRAPASRSPAYVAYVTPRPLWVSRPNRIVVVFSSHSFWSKRSSCATRYCDSNYAACNSIYSFDECACVPDLLQCIQAKCRTEYTAAIAECESAIRRDTLCRLSCAPAAPVDWTTEYVATNYSVVVELLIEGMTSSAWESYGVDVSQLLVDAQVNATSKNDTLLAAWPVYVTTPPYNVVNGSAAALQMTAEVITDDPDGMLEVQSFFLNESTTQWLASTLWDYGVLHDTNQLAITSVQTLVVPLNSTTPSTSSDNSTAALLGVGVGIVVGLGLLGLGYYCHTRRRRPAAVACVGQKG